MLKKKMKAEDYSQHLYIYMNERHQFVLFSGLTFAQFSAAVKMPENLLLLKHGFGDASFNMHTRLEFVTQEEFGRLSKSVSAGKQELCWVDFANEKNVRMLTPIEQAELLYIGHKKEAIRPPFYRALQNDFVYLSAEEEQTVKIYFRNLGRLNELVGNLFTQAIRKEEAAQNFWRRRPKELTPEVPRELLDTLLKHYRNGALLSLVDPEKTKNTIELHVRQAEEISFLDEFWSEIEEYVTQEPVQKLIFDRKTKQWK